MADCGSTTSRSGSQAHGQLDAVTDLQVRGNRALRPGLACPIHPYSPETDRPCGLNIQQRIITHSVEIEPDEDIEGRLDILKEDKCDVIARASYASQSP